MKSQLRERVLSEWRGLPQRGPAPDRYQPVAAGIERVMRALGLSERLTESQVLGAWKEIVGDFIAKHSCPHRLREGVLFVQVLQPTVHYELDRVWKARILQKMKERFGGKVIKDVRFRFG